MPRHSELAKIERTGLEVTKLSLGTAPLGGLLPQSQKPILMA